MTKLLLIKFKEALISVLPITILILVLNFSIVHIPTWDIISFAFGFVFLVFGISLFSLGADMSMIPMGQNMGDRLMRKKDLGLLLLSSFLIGFLVTIAEPDLMVLGEKFGDLKWTIMIGVGIGVGLFLTISTWRVVYKISLKWILIVGYIFIFGIAIIMHFISEEFVVISFDSGGVTTGPITVPFILAFGLGIAHSTKNNQSDEGDNSFGAVAVCSMGPIIAILILKIFLAALDVDKTTQVVDSEYHSISSFIDLLEYFGESFFVQVKEVGVPILMIVLLFLLYQGFLLRIDKQSVIRILLGLFITYCGLVLFLTGAKIGFMNIGSYMGRQIALENYNWILIPLGIVIGFFVVLAEPSVHVLTKQVENITNGGISRKKILFTLAIGVGISIALAMARNLFNISIWYFIIPGYFISIILIFVVPGFFTSIAFDSGGVASGPLTSTFLLPLSMGICSTIYGSNSNEFVINSFGIVTLVAMTPLITIQLLGLNYKFKQDKLAKAMKELITNDDSDDVIITFKNKKKVRRHYEK